MSLYALLRSNACPSQLQIEQAIQGIDYTNKFTLDVYYTTLQYITLHYSDNCFGKLQSLYIVSNYKHYQTDEFFAGV